MKPEIDLNAITCKEEVRLIKREEDLKKTFNIGL